jgi:adenylate cyclase
MTSTFSTVLTKLKTRHIIETLAAFIGGGWLLLEFVHWILVDHYHFPGKSIDIVFITILGALLCTLIWRWFSGREAPRKFKLERVLMPLVLVITVALDINLLLHLKGPESETIPVSKWKNSVAVLPFDDYSPQKDQGYFCNGMAEELINRLSNIRELKVPARTSAFFFNGKADIKEIGRKLDVRTVLEGSIRKVGNRLRVTAQLINISDGFYLWSDTFDRELNDVFQIQDEIALAIADKLKLTLLGDERAKVTKRNTDNIEANILFLKGKYLHLTYTPEGMEQAIASFEQAIQKDPNYALAYSGLADTYYDYSAFGLSRPNDAIPKAKAYLNRALEIDDTLAETHASLGRIIAMYDWNWTKAEQEFKRALELNPNSSIIYYDHCASLTVTGRFEEAIREAERARELDPLSSQINCAVGEELYFAGRFDEAIEDLKKTIIMDANQYYPRLLLGWSYQGKHMTEAAVTELERAFELPGGDNPLVATFLAIAYYRSGARAKAERIFEDLSERIKREYVPSFFLFAVNKSRGDLDQAFTWLERACEDHDILVPYGLVMPEDAFHIPYDEKSAELLQRVGLASPARQGAQERGRQ